MKTQVGDPKEVRDSVLAGVAVMAEDVEKAEELLDGIKADGTLQVVTGSWYTTYAATSDEALDGLSDFQLKLEESKLRHSLALPVPVDRLQTNATVSDGVGKRTFCSVKGLPFQTKKERQVADSSGYDRCFKRPSFWVIELSVDSLSQTKFAGQLYGQRRVGKTDTEPGRLEYQAMTDQKTGEIISQKADSSEEAQDKFHVNASFLFAMVKSVKDLIEAQKRRSGLRAAIYLAPPPEPLTTLGVLADWDGKTHQPQSKKSGKSRRHEKAESEA